MLTIYRCATLGGVERILLNRAHVFQNSKLNIHYDILFWENGTAKEKFIEYLIQNNLDSFVKVVESLEPDHYDYIFSIDVPEVLNFVNHEKLFIECHTGYPENRRYLSSLPSDINGIIVPSQSFAEEIKLELPLPLVDRVHLLSNIVYLSDVQLFNDELSVIYSKIPVVYLGRLDRKKKVEEVIRSVSLYNKNTDDLCLFLVGEVISHEINLRKLLYKYDMINRTVYLPAIRFDKVGRLLEFIKRHKGIYMSASTKESFGMSTAEAIAIGVPVLVHDNPAHHYLLNGEDTYLFQSKDYSTIIKKMRAILSNYELHSTKMLQLSSRLQSNFLKEWHELIKASEFRGGRN